MEKQQNRRPDARGKRISDTKSTYRAGEPFEVTWQFTNRGESVWDAGYTLFQTGSGYGFNRAATPHPLGAPRRVKWEDMTTISGVAAGDSAEFTIQLTAPTDPGDYVCHWQLRDGDQNDVGHPVYIRITVPEDGHDLPEHFGIDELVSRGTLPGNLRSVFVETPMQFGVNINPDDPNGHASPDLLKGVGRVRIVYKLFLRESANPNRPKTPTMQQYKKWVTEYQNAGIDVLFVLNQETVAFDNYWNNWDTPIHRRNGDEWKRYIQQFANVAREIANDLKEFNARKPGSVAYQIWNEGDQLAAHAQDALNKRNEERGTGERKYTLKDAYTLPLDEWQYSMLLQEASKAIKQTDKQATVVTMGLVSGQPAYLDNIYKRNKWAFAHTDAVAVHPYNCVPAGFKNDFPFAKHYNEFSRVLREYARIAQESINVPLWITEVGSKPKGHTNPWLLANYMRATLHDFALNHPAVDAVIWFPWKDFSGSMENPNDGILDLHGNKKDALWKAFAEVRDWLSDGEEPVVVVQPPNPPPTGITAPKRVTTGKTYDIWQYIVGKPGMVHANRSYNADGSENNETVTTIDRNGKKLFIKNGLFETIWLADHNGEPFVWRGLDTSPGAGRMYTVWFNGKEGAPWCPRHMAIGETWLSKAKFFVQHYMRETGAMLNGGRAPNHIKLVAHYPEMKFVNGIVMRDVIQLEWVGNETYYYARDRGLVGWSREHNDPFTPRKSGVCEIHSASRANESDLRPISYANYAKPPQA